MKTSILFASLLVSSVCLAGATISDVIVRQQWPWNASVTVDYLVSGTGGADTQVILRAYRGNTLLGMLPYTALSGDVLVNSDGEKRISFNPSDVDFLASQPSMNDFRIDVSVDDCSTSLYLVLDLAKTHADAGFKTYVTEEAITNGVWGAWVRGPCGMIADSVVWTEVATDTRYSTSHLVLRRIPAGSFLMGEDPEATDRWYGNEITNTTVEITKPYYIGVFPLTSAQYLRIYYDRTTNSVSRLPKKSLYYGYKTASLAIRGTNGATQNNWPSDKTVRADSILGKLRTQSAMDFDLATEAQWEKAARAGSSGPYYHTTATTLSANELEKVAWCSSNSGDDPHDVGGKRPNDYGLYDVLGNLNEFVLDWFVANYTPGSSDPEGPNSSETNVRTLKGGSYRSRAVGSVKDYNLCRLGMRGSITFNSCGNTHGFRVCCPAE